MKESQEKFTRKCPQCNLEIVHKGLGAKYARNEAIKRNRSCGPCAAKERSNRPEQIERRSGKNNPMYGMTGKKNPFYGKRHSEESRQKIRKNRDLSFTQTKEFKEKQRKNSLGEKNSMYGRSVHSVWTQKYGKEEADKKLAKMKSKLSKKNSGEGNPMYGKPSPQGSGNGWKGWYKGRFFRSLREAMFLICYVERFGLEIESLEKKKWAIKYVDPLGQERNYFADYLVNGKYFVEIKPRKLQNSPNNLCKKKAAESFCEFHGFLFKYIDPIIKLDIILPLYKSGEIKFQKKTEQRFLEWVAYS